MKVAIIGASGMAGSRILNELVSRGHQVTAIARNTDKIEKMMLLPPKQLILKIEKCLLKL